MMPVWCQQKILPIDFWSNAHSRNQHDETGVNGRNDVSLEHWVHMDLEYIDKWILGSDLEIPLNPIPIVRKGAGAY
jgi:hypothetical protein